METQNTYIIYLLHKYINSQCTEQELKQLLEWLKYTDDYACFDKVGKALWADINQLQLILIIIEYKSFKLKSLIY